MRPTNAQIDTIREGDRQNFGADVLDWLFGSRVNDFRRGGDADLYHLKQMRKFFADAYGVKPE